MDRSDARGYVSPSWIPVHVSSHKVLCSSHGLILIQVEKLELTIETFETSEDDILPCR